MLKEALEYFAKKVNAAEIPKQAPAVSLRNATTFFHQGEIKRIAHEPHARAHGVHNLDSLGTLVNGPEKDDGEVPGLEPVAPNASVWHAGDQVVVIFDDSYGSFRDDRAVWDLHASKKFKVLTSEANGAATPRLHKQFIQFIVENLRDELEAAAPGLLGSLRQLKFTSSVNADSNVQHGRASYGKAVEEEVAGAEPLPETVIIPVRRWADLDHVAKVECLLIVDPTEGKLSLKPLADELQEAENKAHQWLHDQITGEVDCPVYYGTP